MLIVDVTRVLCLPGCVAGWIPVHRRECDIAANATNSQKDSRDTIRNVRNSSLMTPKFVAYLLIQACMGDQNVERVRITSGQAGKADVEIIAPMIATCGRNGSTLLLRLATIAEQPCRENQIQDMS